MQISSQFEKHFSTERINSVFSGFLRNLFEKFYKKIQKQ